MIIIIYIWGRVYDLSFFEYLGHFCFLSIEFHSTFSISFKILYYVNYYCIWLGSDRPSDFFFSCPLCFFPYLCLSSYLLPVFLYLISFLLFPWNKMGTACCSFILAVLAVWNLPWEVPIPPECLGKHSCMSFPFPIAILKGTFFFH